MTDVSIKQSRTAEHRAKLDELINSGVVQGYNVAPPRKRAAPSLSCGKGRQIQWLLEHVDFNEEKCLFWPFPKDQGCAKNVGYNGKMYRAARIMCTLAHGVPPSDKHEIAYSCFRGDRGCISPKHLCWKTRSENQRDLHKVGKIFPGRHGKITFAQAAEIRAIGRSQPLREIAERYGISNQRVSHILLGQGFIKQPRNWVFRGGRFYSRVIFKGRGHSLGGFETGEAAANAYHSALERLRRGEPAKPEPREKSNPADLRRFHTNPTIRFENEGERVIAVDPDQEQSVFVMHHALDRLNPSVRKFVLVASETGDLAQAAQAAGLNQAQVAVLLPRLKAFLRPIV